jgi:hypothetical protein
VARVHGRYPRIPCVVPFCGCGATCYPPGYEIICPKHYRLVDKRLKARRRAGRRILKRLDQANSLRAQMFEDRAWALMKRQAITRAMAAEAVL